MQDDDHLIWDYQNESLTEKINELNAKSWNIRWAVDNLNPPYGNDLSESRLNSISNIVNLDKSDLNELSVSELIQKMKNCEIELKNFQKLIHCLHYIFSKILVCYPYKF